MNERNDVECGLRLRTHCVHMDDRGLLTITGVTDVGSFCDNAAELVTEGGSMAVEGTGLHVTKLDLEDGRVVIEGLISAIVYEDDRPEKKGSLISRIFR